MISPTLRQHQLATELKHLREDAGVSRVAAAQRLGCSVEKIGHIERARNVPNEDGDRDDLWELLDLYGRLDRFEVLNEIRYDAHQRGWTYSYGLNPGAREYLELELSSICVDRMTINLVPGSLQCRSYTRALTVLYGSSSRETERQLEIQAQRREWLIRPGSNLNVIASEFLIRQTLGLGSAGLDQVRSLRDSNSIPGVSFRVVPFDAGPYRGMFLSFSLLRFPADLMETIGYEDNSGGGLFFDDPEQVEKLKSTFDNANSVALDVDATTKLISDIVDEESCYA